MSRQANGTYIQPANTAAVTATTISSTAFNTLITDIGTEITNSVDRGGRSAMTAALPMGANKITGMADPGIATDGATKNYVDTAITAGISAAGISVPLPQGYLTPTSGTPIISGDVIASTNVFYTFKDGPWLPIHNGTTIVPYQMASQFQLALSASQAANNIYDIFLAYNSNVPVIGTGPSWAAGTGGSVTAGSCARGTGAGGTALTRLNGFNVNAASMSLIWNTGSGNTTITVPANQGIYLGSIFIDGVAGQVTLHRSYGQSRKWAIWNAYNRKNIYLKAGDSASSWTYSTNTIRPSNNSTANSLTTFCGLAEEVYSISSLQKAQVQVFSTGAGGSANGDAQVGVGANSTTAFSNNVGESLCNISLSSGTDIFTLWAQILAHNEYAPSLGINVYTMLERSVTATNPISYFGTEQNMVLSSRWQG